MLDLLTIGIIFYLIAAYILSFATSELRYPKLSWFFIATFWLLIGHLLTVYFSVEFVIIVVLIGAVTVLTVAPSAIRGKQHDLSI